MLEWNFTAIASERYLQQCIYKSVSNLIVSKVGKEADL